MTQRNAYLQKKYGITEADYDALLAAQGGVCAICGKRPGRVRLAVDHDHITRRVRGLLHVRCNQALGPFEYNEAVLERAVAYMANIVKERQEWRKNTDL